MEALGAADKVFELMDRESEMIFQEETLGEPSNEAPPLRFKDVKFHYPIRPNHQVLKLFNLDLPKQSVTALVGLSGAGKSSVAKLATRLYDIQSGSVEVAGINVRSNNVFYTKRT